MRGTTAPQMTPLRRYDVVFDQHTYEGKGLGRDSVFSEYTAYESAPS